MPYAFAHFITDGQGAAEALDLYRRNFRPGAIERPQATACVWALAAETEEEAWFQFRSRERTRIDRLTGRFGPLLPPQDAQRAYSPAEEAEAQALRQRSLVGSAPQVREKLEALAGRLQVDELVILTWAWDPAVQRRSYELLADAFHLA